MFQKKKKTNTLQGPFPHQAKYFNVWVLCERDVALLPKQTIRLRNTKRKFRISRLIPTLLGLASTKTVARLRAYPVTNSDVFGFLFFDAF